MKAEIVLTPSESKRLIAKAIAQMESVKRALKNGVIIIGRGSTNAYIVEEISGQRIDKGKNTAGYIGPKGLGANSNIPKEKIFINGKVKDGASLASMINDLRYGDIIIKGANALGPDRIAGVLCGRGQPDASGGTIGLFQVAAMTRGIEIIIPVGLEKSILTSVLVGSSELSSSKIDYATGMPCGLVPLFGTVVTEIEAMKILTNTEAIPISAGGIGGGEGSIVLLLKGHDNEVKEAIQIVEKIKGEPSVLEPQ